MILGTPGLTDIRLDGELGCRGGGKILCQCKFDWRREDTICWGALVATKGQRSAGDVLGSTSIGLFPAFSYQAESSRCEVKRDSSPAGGLFKGRGSEWGA